MKDDADAVALPEDPLKPLPPLARMRRFLATLGPGLVTGAADDDPSGIATYSQAGAQFGYGLLWSVFLTTPLMIGVQIVSARIGRVSGRGLAANLRRELPRALLFPVVAALVIANALNIAADLAAMGKALAMVAGGPATGFTAALALVSLLLQVFLPLDRYAPILKWLTLSLFAYVATLFAVRVDWGAVAHSIALPPIRLESGYFATLVAVLGTTISPYLFFWQASQEAEGAHASPGEAPLRFVPDEARAQLDRITVDTWTGMILSNGIAFAIVVTTAATLHAAGVTDVQTSEQAADALRPLAGEAAYVLFTLGIVGTGLLAVPVLAGSAAYAVAEAMGWPNGLRRKWNEAPRFYAVLAAITVVGVLGVFADIDPIRALYWSAVVNGVVAVPIMAVLMILAGRRRVMGPLVVGRPLQWLGWGATLLMAAAVAGMALL